MAEGSTKRRREHGLLDQWQMLVDTMVVAGNEGLAPTVGSWCIGSSGILDLCFYELLAQVCSSAIVAHPPGIPDIGLWAGPALPAMPPRGERRYSREARQHTCHRG
ncbi:hypothetical protein ACU8V6_00050 [Vibrio alginolyticus]